MMSPMPRPISEAEDKLFQPGYLQTDSSPCAARVPQIIPEWAINHLGKKVRLIQPYFDGCRTWFPDQVGILDGLQTGTSGIECFVYFEDCEDEGDFSAPAALLMPVCEGNSSQGLPEDANTPPVAKPQVQSFIIAFAIGLLSRARVIAKRRKDDC